jgi:hypothetical protein
MSYLLQQKRNGLTTHQQANETTRNPSAGIKLGTDHGLASS